MLFQLGILLFLYYPVFDACSVATMEWGWSETIYHVSDLNVYIGTPSGEGLKEHFFFVHTFFVLNNEQQPLHFENVQNSNSWIDATRKGFNRAL